MSESPEKWVPVDRSQQEPWIQVIGRIAVHQPERDAHEPQGASRVLLSILIAAGPAGASIDTIAAAYWKQIRPNSWQVALRVSASHLSAQLPDGWEVSLTDGWFRLVPGDGFVDVWRVEESPHQAAQDTNWLRAGAPFAGLTGVDIVDAAAEQLEPLIENWRARTSSVADANPIHRLPSDLDGTSGRWIRGLRRAIVLGSQEDHAQVARACADEETTTHIVVGDRRLLMPLGPFAMTFPELRNEIRLEQGVVDVGAMNTAFRIVAETLATQAAIRPQRLVFDNAHELDTASLKLVATLIERGRLADFSTIIYADKRYRELRWLDFVNRSIIAGCDLVRLPAI